MGDTLQKPVTEKHSSALENEHLSVGATGMQGWRKGMEDAHTTRLSLIGAKDVSFFAVFDGHCGQATARYCGARFHTHVEQQPHFQRGEWKTALEQAYLGVDRELSEIPEPEQGAPKTRPGHGSGCTAVSCLITPDFKIVCANAGDSRCILSRGGEVIALSSDHKPTNEEEIARIQAAGAFVAGGRVNGNLALSRAIGDLEFKQNHKLPPESQAITAFPDVTVTDLCEDDEFIVLACDGIWDVLSNEAVVSFTKDRLRPESPTSSAGDLALICEDLCMKSLAPQCSGLGCDNMTVVLVQFKDEFRKKIAAARRRSTVSTEG
eukprot:Hpha_TRINITY_DN13874_c0_g1::TRINITY_DN13874_c0_g1_i1::g.69841::m.69841/K14803/PTC2_3; protein phosphatase PTC2/3